MKIGVPEKTELRPRITVLGVGGAGGNAVNNMIASKLEGVEFVVANTDAQALAQSRAERQIQIGPMVTSGLGAGAKPEVGRASAEETLDELLDQLSGSHMVFITAGMGGGTGTGAAPVIARAVREQGMLTVGVVTKPFAFEGERRMRIAERGIEELQAFVDTLIIIPNQNLFRVANDRTTFAQAFAMADDVLHSGVRGVTDLIVMPGLINLDFADIKTVMSEMGKAMMGTGEAEGEERALKAAEAAISNPLLDEVSMKGARGVLINITGGADMTLFEVDQAANRIRAEVDPDANIIFGGTLLENMEGRLRVSVVATGIEAEAMTKMPPNVETLRPRNRPVPVGLPGRQSSLPPQPAAVAMRPVMNSLPEDMAAQAPAAQRPPMSPIEPLILGTPGTEDLAAADEDMVEMPPVRHQPVREILPEPKQESKRRRFFGGWSDRKPDVRTEPAPLQRSAAPSRATAQVMTRPLAENPRGPQSTQPDLGLDAEDQFEIPAFLRRQTN
ncbi:MAG: cell division protein FtsZ [Alphaproteobacteria bacterium]|nr:cell division protein FtsZ [Alphaproteobacteria bacterium]